jgi:hypothetical protein
MKVKIKDIVCSPQRLNIVFELMKGDLKGKLEDLVKNEYLKKDTVKVILTLSRSTCIS